MDDVSFAQAKKVPPAFAGILVDWSIGSREVTATILDLVIRDILAVVGDRVIVNRKSKDKKDFEMRFILALFGKKKELSFHEVSNVAYHQKFPELLRIVKDAMKDKIIISNIEENLAQRIKNTMKVNVKQDDYIIKPKRKVKVLKGISMRTFNIITLIYIIGLLSLVFLLFKMSLQNLTLPIILFNIPILIFLLFAQYMSKKAVGNMDWILTDFGKDQKKISLDLKHFMEKYPLVEDRLANELVAHAVAFGIGKKWMKKLGKNKAIVRLFSEGLSCKADTVMDFIDMDKYCNQFF